MQPDPTTWRTTPVCATDAMIEAGRLALRYAKPTITNPEACEIAILMWNAMSAASPRPQTISEPPATRDSDHG